MTLAAKLPPESSRSARRGLSIAAEDFPDIRQLLGAPHAEMSPHVYFTRMEGERVAREWRDGLSPYPAKYLVGEGGAFVRLGWNHWKHSIPDAQESRKSGGMQKFLELIRQSGFRHLGLYHALTGDRCAAILARDLTERIVERFSTWPCSPREYLGSDYVGRFSQWVDTAILNHVAYVVWGIRSSGWITSAFLKDFASRFVREVVEINTLPILEYRTDKYHNVFTDLYEPLMLAGELLGSRLRVRDLVVGRRSWTCGQLAEDAWSGPKGVNFFAVNAFDRGGTYWESSSTYAMHCLNYLLPCLQLARVQGREIPQDTLRRLAMSVKGLVNGIFPTGELPPVSESHFGRHCFPSITEVTAWLSGDLELKKRLPALDGLWNGRSVNKSTDWSKLMHRIFIPESRPRASRVAVSGWRDDLNPSQGQFISRSTGGELAVHLNWDAFQDYHSDYDALSFCLQYRGRFRILDFGYFTPGNPLRSWVRRAQSHSTVSVNDENQRGSMRYGTIESQVSSRDFSWIRVSAPHVCEATRVYRRSLLVLKTKPWTVVDVFEVEGGWGHDDHLNGVGKPEFHASRDGRSARCVWRDDDGVWLMTECEMNAPGRAELRPLFPGKPFQKLTLVRRGVAPLRSVFVHVITLGDGHPVRSGARIFFGKESVRVSLPARRGRRPITLELEHAGPTRLRTGEIWRRLGAWRGRQVTLSRDIRIQIGRVLDAHTIQTSCLACWPLEKGMILHLGRRRHVLDAWQFSGVANRMPMERSAFEPRCLRLRFKGPAFLKTDINRIAGMSPPAYPVIAPPAHPL